MCICVPARLQYTNDEPPHPVSFYRLPAGDRNWFASVIAKLCIFSHFTVRTTVAHSIRAAKITNRCVIALPLRFRNALWK